MTRCSTLLAALACFAIPARAQTPRKEASLQRGSLATASLPSIASARTPIAAREIARGTVLAAADIVWSDSVVAPAGARDSVSAGWVARRSFRAGEVLEAPGVSPPDLVTSGDMVNLIYTAPGVAITLRGTAVGSGARGDQVYVRLDNRRRLRGVVAGANTVRVM